MLNSNKFKTQAKAYYTREFNFILSKISECSEMMIERYDSIENNENKIRNRLYKDFLKNNLIREQLGLTPYIFHPEVPEINEDYFEEGRTDLIVYNATTYSKNTNAYYVLECKRLDGTTSLNEKYVENGVLRFVQEKYPTNLKSNCMIGFIVKEINISENLKKIVQITTNNVSTNTISFADLTSVHSTISQKEIYIKHLMLDFSSLT